MIFCYSLFADRLFTKSAIGYYSTNYYLNHYLQIKITTNYKFTKNFAQPSLYQFLTQPFPISGNKIVAV